MTVEGAKAEAGNTGAGQDQANVSAVEKLKNISAGVFEGDYEALQALAGELSLSRSLLVRYAVRDFIQRYQTGAIRLEVDPERALVHIRPPATDGTPASRAAKKKSVSPAKDKKRRLQAKGKGKGNGKGTGKKKKKKKGKKK